eukprot:762523-Hanusia_phi.AAC.6
MPQRVRKPLADPSLQSAGSAGRRSISQTLSDGWEQLKRMVTFPPVAVTSFTCSWAALTADPWAAAWCTTTEASAACPASSGRTDQDTPTHMGSGALPGCCSVCLLALLLALMTGTWRTRNGVTSTRHLAQHSHIARGVDDAGGRVQSRNTS